jgi:hypothetical protein
VAGRRISRGAVLRPGVVGPPRYVCTAVHNGVAARSGARGAVARVTSRVPARHVAVQATLTMIYSQI